MPRLLSLIILATMCGTAGAEMAVGGDLGSAGFFYDDINISDELAIEPVSTTVAPTPERKEAPVKVVVDQAKQEACITHPDGRFCTKVSTGGTIKIRANAPPKCASTTNRDRLYIPKIKEEDVLAAYDRKFIEEQRTRGLDDRQIRQLMSSPKYKAARIEHGRREATMFKKWESRTYTDERNNPIPLRNAIKVGGNGEFLHCVPAGYESTLGRATSGGCIRLSNQVCKKLYDLMDQHGAIEVTIHGEAKEAKCDPEQLRAIQLAWQRGELRKQTGSEGVLGDDFISDFFRGLGQLFSGGGSQPSQQKRRSQPTPSWDPFNRS